MCANARASAAAVPYTGRAMAPPRRARALARAPTPRLGRAADQRPHGARERGCSSRCRCSSPRSRSAGRSRCRRRRCRRRSTRSTAAQLARELARDYPDRSPGSAGALGAAPGSPSSSRCTASSRRRTASRRRFPGRGRVAAAEPRRGRARRLAARDRGHGPPRQQRRGARRERQRVRNGGADRARPRVRPGVGHDDACRRSPSHTLVFVSTDGGAFGALGAARFAEQLAVPGRCARGGQPRRDRGLGRRHGSLIAGDTARSPAAALVRTAAVRVLEQTGQRARRARRALRQLLDLGFPFTLGEQGAVRRAAASRRVTLTTVPDAPAPAFEDDPLSAARLGELGRAAQSSSARSTPGSSSRRERRATSISARGSSAAGRSSSSC